MGKRRNDDAFELAWGGLVVIPGTLGFLLGVEKFHSITAAGVLAGVGAGIGIGLIVLWQNRESDKLRRSGIHEIDRMPGHQFEQYLGSLFRSLGYKTQVTRESGDYGADLVLERDARRFVVQAKRYKGNVGIKAVQEVQAAIAHYKAHEAWVVTNSGFTQTAMNLAKSNGVKLIGRQELIQLVLRMKSTENATAATTETARASGGKTGNSNPPSDATVRQREVLCERCGKRMLLKRTALGLNYICSGFPSCKNIKSVDR